jgi:hypothetical protein
MANRKFESNWTDEEIKLFNDTVINICNVENVAPAKFSAWSKVSNIVKTKSNNQCRAKWLSQLKSETASKILGVVPQWTTKDDFLLVERLNTLFDHAEDEDEVNWKYLESTDDPWSALIIQHHWNVLKTRFIHKDEVEVLTFKGFEYFLKIEIVNKINRRLVQLYTDYSRD